MEREAARSLYNFLVEDWLKTVVEKPAKEEDKQNVEILDEKEEDMEEK
jgi:hypothetical protein